MTDAVDSADSYDSAAHAAISFASEDIQACADTTAHATPQWLIHRTQQARADRMFDRYDAKKLAKQAAFQARMDAYKALGATDDTAEALANMAPFEVVGRALYAEGLGCAGDLTRFAPAHVKNVISPHAFDMLAKIVGAALAAYDREIISE